MALRETLTDSIRARLVPAEDAGDVGGGGCCTGWGEFDTVPSASSGAGSSASSIERRYDGFQTGSPRTGWAGGLDAPPDGRVG